MPAYEHLAVLHVSTRRFDSAVETLARAQSIDALWPMLKPMEALVWYCRREFELAVAAGRTSVDLHPYFPLGRHLFAQALEQSGRMEEALEQHRLACVMSPDVPWLRAEEAACLARAGRAAKAWEIYEELQWLRQREYVSAFSMMVLLDALGRRDLALDELDRSFEENAAFLFLLDADPKLDPLRGEPRFQRVWRKLFSHLLSGDRAASPASDAVTAASY
jgi:serine/threonine-protein kinase